MKFDPMTGEPIYETEEERQNAQAQAGGQTPPPQQPSQGEQTPPPQQLSQGGQTPPPQQLSQGEQTPPPQQSSQGGQTPLPQQPIPPQMQQDYGTVPQKKGGALKYIIIAVVACVAVLGGSAFALVKSGIFMGDSARVLKACINTYHPYEIVDDLDCQKIIESRNYTVRVEGNLDGDDFGVSMGQKNDTYALEGSGTIEGIDMDVKASLDPEQLRLSVPFLDKDSVFVYDYTADDNDGYLMKSMDEDELDALNAGLTLMTSTKEQEQLQKNLIKGYQEEYNKLELEKIDEDTFQVNDKDVSCKGYELTITEENMDDFISITEDAYKEYFGNSVYEIMGYGDIFDSMKEDIDGTGDIKARFYLYKKQLAHVQLEDSDQETIDIAFLGGDYRMQNMEITSSDGETVAVSEDMDGSDETIEVTYEGQTVFETNYDTKSGDYDIAIDADGSTAKVSGTITGSGKEKVITVDSVKSDEETVPLDMTITVSKGMKFEKLDGDEKDIGKMDQNDWEDIITEYYGALYDLY